MTNFFLFFLNGRGKPGYTVDGGGTELYGLLRTNTDCSCRHVAVGGLYAGFCLHGLEQLPADSAVHARQSPFWSVFVRNRQFYTAWQTGVCLTTACHSPPAGGARLPRSLPFVTVLLRFPRHKKSGTKTCTAHFKPTAYFSSISLALGSLVLSNSRVLTLPPNSR